MTDLELTIEQTGLELTETHQPLPPDCCTTWVKAMSYYCPANYWFFKTFLKTATGELMTQWLRANIAFA